MTAPVLFVTVFTIAGWLRADYDALSMFISELSHGPRGWIQTANFVVLGFLLLVFACGVADAFKKPKAPKSAAPLIAIIAVCVILSGAFKVDPGAELSDQTSWQGAVHVAAATVAFVLMPVSCYICYRHFRDDTGWQWFAGPTFAACAVIVAAALLQEAGQHRIFGEAGLLIDLAGLLQRVMVVTYLAWIFVFARGLRSARPG